MSEVNNSVIKAMNIIDLFLKDEELNITEMQKITGLSRTSINRIVNSLVHTNYLVKDAETSKYSIGTKMFFIVNTSAKYGYVIKTVKEHVDRLSDIVSRSVSVTVMENNKNVAVYVKKSNKIISIIPEVGTTRELNCSASGKVLVAFSKNNSNIIDNIDFQRLTNNTIVNNEEFRKVVEKVKITGYAIDDEEAERGLFCISMPVFGINKQVFCTISVSGFKDTMIEDMDFIKNELKKCTDEISANIK